jgi:hypothetical protein
MARKPDFIGPGAQKAATSWIHACLYEHPQIYMPGGKEIHFFSRHYAKGFQWYENHFRRCRPDQLAGEFSPTYLYDPKTPQRLAEWNPEVKLIICLRNPVERTISAYRYAVKMGEIPPERDFAEVIRRKPAYLHHSRYKEQLDRYLQYFPREQLLILLYEDIAKDPYEFIQNIYRFLRIDWQFRPSLLDNKVNESVGVPRFRSLNRIKQNVAASLRNAGLEKLVWRVAQSNLAEAFTRLNRKKTARKSIPKELNGELCNLFAAEAQALAQFLQRDLRTVWFDYALGQEERGVL